MSEESLLDLGFLTEEERDIIHSVIFKDAEIRKQEQSRISVLRKELDELREAGLPEHQIESKNEQYCARCQTYFGIILNKGALCPRCNLKVCKTCRKNVAEAGWMCTLCSKVREVKAQSGAWFFQGYKEKSGNLFGSMLVRKSLRRLPSTQSLQEEKRNKHSVLSNTDLANHDQPHQDNYGYATKNHVQSQHKSSDHGSHQGILNGGRQVEYFDSDVDSDDSDHDDHHSAGTGSERSHSKEGGSDGSESLESDHEADTSRTLRRYSEEVPEETWGTETAVESQTGVLLQSDVGVKPGGQIESPEEPLTVHDRPVSSSLVDDDISYTPAPKFDLSSKRRQFSDSNDATLRLGGPESREPERRSREAERRSRDFETPSRESKEEYDSHSSSHDSEAAESEQVIAPRSITADHAQRRCSEPELTEAILLVKETSRESEGSSEAGIDRMRDGLETTGYGNVHRGDMRVVIDTNVDSEEFGDRYLNTAETTEKPSEAQDSDNEIEHASEDEISDVFKELQSDDDSRTPSSVAVQSVLTEENSEEAIFQEKERVVESSSDISESYDDDGEVKKSDKATKASKGLDVVMPDFTPEKIGVADDGGDGSEMLSVFARIKSWERKSTESGFSPHQKLRQPSAETELNVWEESHSSPEKVSDELVEEAAEDKVSWTSKGDGQEAEDSGGDVEPGSDGVRSEDESPVGSGGEETTPDSLRFVESESNLQPGGFVSRGQDDAMVSHEKEGAMVSRDQGDVVVLLEENDARVSRDQDGTVASHGRDDALESDDHGDAVISSDEDDAMVSRDHDDAVTSREQDDAVVSPDPNFEVEDISNVRHELQSQLQTQQETALSVPESIPKNEDSVKETQRGSIKSEYNIKSGNFESTSPYSNLAEESIPNSSSSLSSDTFVDLKLQHEEPDVEPKSDEKSSSSEADKYEASPGNEHVSLVGYGDENAEMAANPPTGDPQGELEVPQEPHDYLSNVYQDDEKETEEIDRKPEPSEASPTAEDLSLSMRENALLAFSETFSSVHTSKSSFPRGDPAGSRESNDEGDRRLSDPRTDDHDVFNPDNESSFTETSGYVTPTASEDASSKQTPSISGDDGSRRSKEDYGQHELEQAPIIVTTDADDAPRSNHPPIDFEEDLEVSFSKYGTGLGNRKLKDQLSMGSRESIVSYYSNAGGEVYGKYPVTGEIYFGMKYDAIQQEFQVQIHQAKEITPVDEKNNVSDPYVKTYLLPDRSRGGKRKTKVKKNTINPVYDEILSYKISYDEILQRTLWVAIWNHDRFGHNDFLGEVLVPIDVYQQSGFSLEDPEPQWYTLCERQAEDPDLLSNGEIVIALKYVPPSAVVSKKKKKKKKGEEEKGELHINIIEATNLIAKDSNGFSDPFCKSYLLPDKSKKTKQKTAVVKKSLNPKWNYHFVYDNVTHMDLMDRVLELTVWDFDRGSSNDFLGGVRLGLGAGIKEWDDANSEEQAAWNKMLNNHNDWNQVTLVLRDNMGNHKDYILRNRLVWCNIRAALVERCRRLLVVFEDCRMDLFRIETGAIPAHSCHEESSPMLQNHSSATGRPSKAFLVHDSVSCITNVAFALDESAKTGLLKDRPNESKAFKGKDTGLHMKDHGGKTSPGSPEYQFLSPCNLEDPLSSSLWSTTQTHLAAKPSEKETDCLLQSADSEINHNNKRNQFSSPSTPAIDYSKAGLPSGGHTSTVPTRPDKLSGASTSPENDDGRRKTLEELAKEWRAKQENGPKKDVCWKVESAETHCDDQSLLVRHTDYYTSSGTNGMTSEENRIRNKLKTRLHLNEESVNRMRSHGGQTLVKLAGN